MVQEVVQHRTVNAVSNISPWRGDHDGNMYCLTDDKLFLFLLAKTGVVYKFTCNNCDKIYIGVTGRKFGVRSKEHKQEVDDLPTISEPN